MRDEGSAARFSPRIAADIRRDGACLIPQAAGSADLAFLIEHLPRAGAAGRRLVGVPWLADWLSGSMVPVVERVTGSSGWRPVRAILFDKSATANWSLGWHQDRTVAVRSRVERPGYERWSTKDRIQHVEPPFAIIDAMTTLRLHIDAAGCDNGPLRIVRGSHRLGRIAEAEIAALVSSGTVLTCTAAAGDAWLYSTPVLHASAKSGAVGRRRVLHVDLSREALAPGIEWLGLSA